MKSKIKALDEEIVTLRNRIADLEKAKQELRLATLDIQRGTRLKLIIPPYQEVLYEVIEVEIEKDRFLYGLLDVKSSTLFKGNCFETLDELKTLIRGSIYEWEIVTLL